MFGPYPIQAGTRGVKWEVSTPRRGHGQDFADAIAILTRGGIDRARHITGVVPLEEIVAQGFVPLTERRAEHVKIQVYPG